MPKRAGRKKRSKRRRPNIFIALLLLVGIFFTIEYVNLKTVDKQAFEVIVPDTSAVTSIPVKEQTENPKPIIPPKQAEKTFIDLTKTHSLAILLTDLETGETLAEKNSKLKLYPASLTKIMTAILAIEMEPDLEQEIVMQPEYFENLFEMEAAIAGFQEGEKVPFHDLLYGTILPSGADASLAIAFLLGGSEAGYVDLMNQKARELGMADTHFMNATGLHDNLHYSSVHDISLLLNYALQNDTFYEVFTTEHYTTEPTNFNLFGVSMNSTVFRFNDEYPVMDEKVIGGKTGFTEEAGQSLATLAKIDGKYYTLITAGAGAQTSGAGPDYIHLSEPFHIVDASLIYSQLPIESR